MQAFVLSGSACWTRTSDPMINSLWQSCAFSISYAVFVYFDSLVSCCFLWHANRLLDSFLRCFVVYGAFVHRVSGGAIFIFRSTMNLVTAFLMIPLVSLRTSHKWLFTMREQPLHICLMVSVWYWSFSCSRWGVFLLQRSHFSLFSWVIF